MKALARALVLAPVVLLSLTACEKLSDDKAQERINGYSLKDVSDKYASVDIKSHRYTAFGDSGEGYVRISYAASMD